MKVSAYSRCRSFSRVTAQSFVNGRALLTRYIGVTGDTISRLIRYTAFNPALTLPLVLLARYTQQGNLLAQDHASVFKGLKTLLGLGALSTVNAWLNSGVTNNWTKDEYVWSREVVVVTGGSDGIGKIVVQLLAEKGFKVAVLDVQDLTYEGMFLLLEAARHIKEMLTPASTTVRPLLQMRPQLPRRHRRRSFLNPLHTGKPHGPHQQCRCRTRQDHPRVDRKGHQPDLQGQHFQPLLPRPAVPS